MIRWCRDHAVLLLLLIAALGLLGYQRPALPELVARVDWPTLAALAGLLMLARGIEQSGALRLGAVRLLQRVTDQQRLALLLVGLSAALAAIITNDVSLFVLVPLTRALAERARLPLARLIALEALAVNAGSSLTPIGNPQNLFLWHVSGLALHSYVAMMGPCVAVMLLFLVITVLLMVSRQPIALESLAHSATIDRRLLFTALTLFVLFIAALQLRVVVYALPIVTAVFLLRHPSILRSLDWSLLVVIGLMFIDLRSFGALSFVAQQLQHLPLANHWVAYATGIALSQVISNVPATILLQPHVADLPTLARAVNIGGFGLVVGSLANFIALRLARTPGGYGEFHRLAVPFLLCVTASCAFFR
jgi:Na+/H+ antiporter NhaD/arsenite permease-like protein